MKKMKKILAFVMAMAMVLGMSVTALAEENPYNPDGVVGTRDDRGDIIVKGIEEAGLTTVKAYPVVTAKYNETTGNFEGYDNDVFENINSPTKEELEAITPDETKAITLTYNSTDQTYRAAEKQPIGMYLVIVPSTDSTTYNRAVASIYYSNDNGTTNVIESKDLTMTTKVAGSDTWVKKDVNVNVDKKVATAGTVAAPGNTAKIGEILNYEVTIDHIPNYNGKYPKLKVTDVLSAGLTYQDDVKVYIDGAELDATKYIVNYDEDTRTLTVNFVKEETTGEGADAVTTYTYLLGADEVGKAAVIKYSAKLNENAQLNGKDNGNTVQLDYTRDSSVEDDGGKSEDKTHTYTFDIDGQTANSITKEIINKKGEKTTENDEGTLDGATFTLYQNKGGLKLENYENEDAFRNAIAVDANIYTNDSFEGTTTTANGGQVKITGLAAGKYYLKETEAPSPYSLNTHVFEIEIIAEPDATTGELATWSINIDGTPTAQFSVNHETNEVERTDNGPGIDIQNTKLSTLPSTGGIGTTIFTIGGCAIMIIAAGLYFASRRKSAK